MIVLMFGDKTTQTLGGLKDQNDTLELLGFEDIIEMINNISNRGIIIDRLVMSSKMITKPQDLETICDYLSADHPRAIFILIGQKGKDEALATRLNTAYNNPLYTDAIVTQMTLPLLDKIVTRPVDKIRKQLSIHQEEELHVVNDSYDLAEDKSEKVENVVSTVPMRNYPQDSKQFKRIYSKKKKPTKEELDVGEYNYDLSEDFFKSLT